MRLHWAIPLLCLAEEDRSGLLQSEQILKKFSTDCASVKCDPKTAEPIVPKSAFVARPRQDLMVTSDMEGGEKVWYREESEPSLPDEGSSAMDKLEKIWNIIAAEKAESRWPFFANAARLFIIDLGTSFTQKSDAMPKDHAPRVIHPLASYAKVELHWDAPAVQKHGYTGLFQSDQVQSMLRLSSGATKPSDTGFSPGLSLKVFRDGRPSANMFGLYSLRGQTGFNQFKHTLCSKFAAVEGMSLTERLQASAFDKVSNYRLSVGTSDWAHDGQNIDNAKFPFVLCFRPSVNNNVEPAKFEHVQDQLGQLEAGTVIYDIYAAAEPGQTPENIGNMRMVSTFHESAWADMSLFFSHQFFEDDLALRQDWAEVVNDPNFWLQAGPEKFYGSIDPAKEQ